MLWQDCILGLSVAVYLLVCSLLLLILVMVGGVYAVYRMTDRITITPHLFSVIPSGPQVWGLAGRIQVRVISASSWERAHGQRVLLVNRVQVFCAHGVSDELKLLWQCLAAVCHADIGDVGTADVVAHRTLLRITGAQPVAFGLESGEATWVGGSDTSETQKETYIWLTPMFVIPYWN